MVGGLWFLLALGATGLHVETDTPDALCPPLEPVRHAVRSRLGVVEGGPYEARYAVVRGGNREPDVLVLTLEDASGNELLRRELPLASLGCSDAAEVIALVLERFFQQMSGVDAPSLSPEDEAPPAIDPPYTPDAPASAGESTRGAPGTTDLADDTPARAATPDMDGTSADGEHVRPSSWSLRGNASFHSTLIPGAGLGVGLRTAPWMQVMLDATWPLGSRPVDEQGLELSTHSSWLFGSGLFLLERGPWSFGAGPVLGLELQQAEIEGAPDLAAGRKARVLFGAGGHAVARFLLSDPLQLELGVRALPMLTGAARKFAVRRTDGQEIEVLRPAGLSWTASVGLNVRLGGDP